MGKEVTRKLTRDENMRCNSQEGSGRIGCTLRKVRHLIISLR